MSWATFKSENRLLLRSSDRHFQAEVTGSAYCGWPHGWINVFLPIRMDETWEVKPCTNCILSLSIYPFSELPSRSPRNGSALCRKKYPHATKARGMGLGPRVLVLLSNSRFFSWFWKAPRNMCLFPALKHLPQAHSPSSWDLSFLGLDQFTGRHKVWNCFGQSTHRTGMVHSGRK